MKDNKAKIGREAITRRYVPQGCRRLVGGLERKFVRAVHFRHQPRLDRVWSRFDTALSSAVERDFLELTFQETRLVPVFLVARSPSLLSTPSSVDGKARNCWPTKPIREIL